MVTKKTTRLEDGIASGRLNLKEYKRNFSDLHPPLSKHEALVAAERCYYCYDAPCTVACPTEIDVPQFIRQIATDNLLGAAKTIFDQNILGGMCARVCPTETLCEQACVREYAECKPVQIGLLQRYATDKAMVEDKQFFKRSAATGKTIAVVGAGAAGLACAHRLAMHGNDVVIYDANKKLGGLNEYGIAVYKTLENFAQREIEYIMKIGGIKLQHNKRLGKDLELEELRTKYDAVFIGIGLGDVNKLGINGENADGVVDAVEFINQLRQTKNFASVPIGRRVVVIGGGMTAIDAAVQSKLLGAEEVTLCYRRGQAQMNASLFEQELASHKGVTIRHNLQPSKIVASKGKLTAIEFKYTETIKGKLHGTGQKLRLGVDQVLTAIGQTWSDDVKTLKMKGGKLLVNQEGKTSVDGVWAGGDCATGGEDLTVTATAMGRDAAEDIHRALTEG